MKLWILIAIGALMAGSATLYASNSFTIANLPTLFSNVSVSSDLSYGPLEAQRLDIYTPETSENHSLPVIVFFYGGRWTEGRKQDYAFVGHRLAKQGFIVVIPDYRKYPNVKFPVFVEDGAAATAWVHSYIADHGGDPDRLFLAGHSAGAHIAALIAVDPKYLQAHRKTRNIISAFAGLAGPYNFIPEDEDLKDMFGPPERYKQMQAPEFIDGQQPPMLLLHGLDDDVFRLYNSKTLAAKIRDIGGDVEIKTYPGIDHIEIIGALTVFWNHKAPVANDLVNYFQTSQR
ncbi:MAG: alpha/beta hydrolase [Hyphomicrobiales bacterium]|nr:alpha/beta hydrolase [Hyphomicrobiales bacterium]